jgi:hypothetical protein
LDIPDGVVAARIYRGRKLLFKLLTEIELIKNFTSNHESNDGDAYTIFKLRDTASLTDDELSETDKAVLQENLKTDSLLKTEFQIQEQMKMLISKSVKKVYAPARLKRKIKKKAEKRFSTSI